MRHLLALLLISTAFAAPNNLHHDFQKLANYYPPIEQPSAPIYSRAKRAVYAVLGITNSCEPGWTGSNCENPICDYRLEPPTTSGSSVLVEFLELKGSCDGKFFLPVDTDMSRSFTIEVTASGTPTITLTSATGYVVEPTSVFPYDGYAMNYFTHVQPGPYQLSVDNQNVPTQECIIEVTTSSNLTAINAFVNTPQSDYAPSKESAIAGRPMYFVAHMVDRQLMPGSFQTVTIRKGASLTPDYRSHLTRRYLCDYEYYAGGWECEVNNEYFYHIDGIDGDGYAFRRSGRFSCMQPITTTTAPTTKPAPLTQCYNNGTLIKPTGGKPRCFCSELFTGDQCEKVLCMNGGFPDPDEGLICECKPGYQGQHCQDVKCPLNWEPFLTDYKTLIVVIHDTANMNQYLKNIATAIKKEIDANEMYEYDVYKGYILVKFANGKFENNFYPVYETNNFLKDIQVKSKNNDTCSEVTFDAISTIFTDVAVYQKSPIYLFTDAIAKDADKWQTIVEMNTREKFPIYSMFFAQSNCNVDKMSDGFQAIEFASYFSGGMVINSDPKKLEMTFQNLIKSTTYKMNSVLIDDMQVCASPTRVFFVDTSTTELMIIAVGEQLTLTVTDPNGNSNTLMKIAESGDTTFYEIPNPIVGEHLLNVISTSPNNACSYRVQARSEYDLFIGTSSGVADDASDSEPVVGQTSHIVAQLTGLKNNVKDQFRLFSEIAITSNVNTDNIYQKPLYYSSGKYRDGCGFHLYFGAVDFCEFDSQPFYATVYADDGNGFTIQRTTTGYCSATPTTPSPPNSCQNGGVFDPNNNSTCICPPNFRGRFCQDIVCENGGTPRGSVCMCPTGLGGTFCELYSCTEINTKPDLSFEDQSIAFVISARDSMKDAMKKINDNIQDSVRDIQQASATWITKWILVVTNTKESKVLIETDRPHNFVDAVNNLYTNFDKYIVAADTCRVQLQDAMLKAAKLSKKRSTIWTFTDSDGPDDLNYIELYDTVQEKEITLNLVGYGDSICTMVDDKGKFPEYIISLVSNTNGDIYMTTDIDQILLFTISMYKSAVSHRYFVKDCSSGTTYYMPVDGWTQSLTLAVTGEDLNSVQVFYPDGTAASNSYYEIQAINGPELKLNQYISMCDGVFNWNYYKQNCYEYGFEPKPWLDSWNYCHDENAMLLHITNQDINDHVHGQLSSYRAWIGLAFNNGTWYWDVPNGNYPQPLTGYTNWADGVDPTKPKFNHVVMNKDGKWEPADPNELNFPVCQKHRYGQGIVPGEQINVIPPGLWKINVQSNKGSCQMQARSQSEIQVFYGFVNDPRSDFIKSYANIQSDSNYLVAIPTGVFPFTPDTNPSMEGHLNYAVIGSNGTITNALPMGERLCSYADISKPFACPVSDGTASEFEIKFTGLDQYGYAFERYSNALCTKYVTHCNNDGFLVNGKCQCRGGWSGPSCSTPVCQNEGIELDGKCQCPPEFTGVFCQHAYCEPPFPKAFNNNGKTLVIALETSYVTGSAIFQLKKHLNASLTAIKNDPNLQGWFSNYILYPFDSAENKASWYPPVVSNNSDDIVEAVKKIPIMTCPGDKPCSAQCPRPIVGVVDSILDMKELAVPNSVVLVITRSSPEDYTRVSSVAQKLQKSKVYLNFVYSAIDSPCGDGWNTEEADALYHMVSYSQGSVFTASASDISQNFLTKYLPTLYSSGGLASGSGNCKHEEILFEIEHETYEFSIDFYHPMQTKVQVYDPAGEVINLPDNAILSDTNSIYIVRVNETGATRAGTYRAVFEGNGGNNCYINIRARSKLEMFVGFVDSNADHFNGSNTDDAHFAPINLEMNTIVAHVNDIGKGRVTYAQVVLPMFGLVHTTVMKRRDSACSYEWYGVSPYSFDYDNYIVVLYGISEHGSNWQRNFFVSSIDQRPPSPPPPAHCDLSLVKQDTLFLIDSSLKSDDSIFKQLKEFAKESVQPYSYPNNFSQVAGMTLYSEHHGGFSFNAGESSYERVVSLIDDLQYDNKPGQNLTNGLQYVLDYYDQPAQGYRIQEGVKHVLVYVTNTNPTDDDPSALVRTIKRSGLYDVVVISYAMEPSDKLKGLVSDRCMYNAKNVQDLMNYGINLVQGQSCRRFNFCNY